MEYHLVSVHTCAIRFHPSVRLRQHGSDFLDSYSAYHYEANCITLYRWGRYSTGSRCEACNSEAQECRRNQHQPCFAKSIKTGCCGPTGAVVFQPVRSNPALEDRRLHKRDRAMPRPLHHLGTSRSSETTQRPPGIARVKAAAKTTGPSLCP